MGVSGPSVGVVGHIEWVRFAHVEHVPGAGEVAHARDPFEEPAGGGGVAAVQLARLAGGAQLFTALGEDEHGRASLGRLRELGVEVHAKMLSQPTRTAITLIDPAGERTIVTFGARLQPTGAQAAVAFDAIYFTAGDVAALRWARGAARVLVASPRAREALGHGVQLDALVLSGDDQIELADLEPVSADAKLLCFSEGAHGGRYTARAGASGRWAAAALPGPRRDSYGCGDSFAAGLTYALGAGFALDDALAVAARCGACCATGWGPYERQLSAADLAAAS